MALPNLTGGGTTAAMWRTLFSCVVVLLAASFAGAELRLPGLFTDHAVLQRDIPVPVWGWADPAAEVTVAVAGRAVTGTADAEGRWLVRVGPLEAGGPHEMLVSAGDERVRLQGVLVGEVWLASGQSNMEWPLRRTDNAEEAIAAADHPRIRLFTVPRNVAQEPADDAPGAWEVCSPETVQDFSAVAYYFGRKLHGELDVPVGLIDATWGGTRIAAWTSRSKLESIEGTAPFLESFAQALADYPRKRAEWEKAVAEYEARGDTSARRPAEPVGPRTSNGPAVLYNGMIHPLVPYALRGVIWYQGESDAGRAEHYRTLFPALIGDWRERWDAPGMPFLFVQLANHMAPADEPTDTPWAHLRDAQLHTLRTVPNTGMAVAIDIGDAKDIHPRNKLDVGERLARWALADTYGRDVVRSGPIYNPAELGKSDREFLLTFEHAQELKTRDGGPLKGFTAAGENGVFVSADATIVKVAGRPAVEVTVPDGAIEGPIVAVRYAWANNPTDANLVNEEGLPATPFRTDSFAGPTDGNR